jgi:hypothetical protein
LKGRLKRLKIKTREERSINKKILFSIFISYLAIGTVCYTFFWDKLPVKKKELTLKVFNKLSAKVHLEWIEGVFINPLPVEIAKSKIPVFGIVKVITIKNTQNINYRREK